MFQTPSATSSPAVVAASPWTCTVFAQPDRGTGQEGPVTVPPAESDDAAGPEDCAASWASTQGHPGQAVQPPGLGPQGDDERGRHHEQTQVAHQLDDRGPGVQAGCVPAQLLEGEPQAHPVPAGVSVSTATVTRATPRSRERTGGFLREQGARSGRRPCPAVRATSVVYSSADAESGAAYTVVVDDTEVTTATAGEFTGGGMGGGMPGGAGGGGPRLSRN
ncbi:hypothetical protein [Blastococcus sp. SYSU DS0539]